VCHFDKIIIILIDKLNSYTWCFIGKYGEEVIRKDLNKEEIEKRSKEMEKK